MATSAQEVKGDARDDRLQGPMKALHKEREHVRKQMLKDARDACPETRAAYVECAKGARLFLRTLPCTARLHARCTPAHRAFVVAGRTLSLPFMCRTLFKEFNACLSNACALLRRAHAAPASCFFLGGRSPAERANGPRVQHLGGRVTSRGAESRRA
jgi:hypothetical protein